MKFKPFKPNHHAAKAATKQTKIDHHHEVKGAHHNTVIVPPHRDHHHPAPPHHTPIEHHHSTPITDGMSVVHEDSHEEPLLYSERPASGVGDMIIGFTVLGTVVVCCVVFYLVNR